jgi:hypothetical protein
VKWLALLLLAAGPALAAPQVFLVQNSGWMEPFYSDPASQYKALVSALATSVASPGDPVVLASFNQGLPGAPSPRALLSLKAGPDLAAKLDQALAPLAAARKPGSAALADTDLNEALGAAIGTALGGKPGLVWLFTNNRNSPNNDQATARRNREFYETIHNGGAITKALAWPLRMPVQGATYRANGLMVYVFAIGDEGARSLDALLASGRIARVITEPAARLKPLDRDTVRLVPRKVEGAPGVDFTIAANGMLRADVQPDARSPNAKIVWQLENTMYPYTIASATLAARSVLAREDKPIALGSSKVAALAPGKGMPLSSNMQLPVAQLPGAWSMEALKAAGSAYVLPGTIELSLANQKLELSQAFRNRMAALFPGDPLPDIFTPPAAIHASTVRLPVEVRVHYGLAPLVLLIGGVVAALGAAAALALALSRPRKALVTVDGELRTMHTKAGATLPIYDRAGNQVASLKTSLFGHRLADLRDGAQVRLGR